MTLFTLVSAAGLQAQFKVPDVIRRGGEAIQRGRFPQVPLPTQNPRQRNGQPATASPAQCHALVAWLGQLPREYPGVDFYNTVMGPKLYDKAINLFRDESFQPFYGKPYAQTSPAERLEFHQKYLRNNCAAPGQLSAEEQAIYRQLRVLVERPFLPGREFSAEAVVRGLDERQSLLSWAQQTTQGLDKLPETPGSIFMLDQYLRRGQIDLEKLWPREQQAFLGAVTARRSVVARSILDGAAMAAGQQTGNGRDGMKAIAGLYAVNARYIQMLDPAAQEQVRQQEATALQAALQSALPQERRTLAAMPKGLDGALAIAAWRREFEAETRGLLTPPELPALLDQATQQRRKLLTASLPEFRKIVAEQPKASYKGMNAVELMVPLFPDPADRSLPEYAQYQTPLAARLEVIAKAEQTAQEKALAAARAATAAAATASETVEGTGKGPKTSCDTLAAHPGDGNRLAGIAGVSDKALVPGPAIKACLQAVKAAPAMTRYQFQLGRAYWAAKKYGEAVDAFLAAEDKEYAPAYFYLAQAYDQGLVDGEKADAAFAKELYQLAAAEGFPPALEIAGANGDLMADNDGESGGTLDYLHPDWVKALVAGDMPTLEKGEFTKIWSYLSGMQDVIAEASEEDRDCYDRYQEGLFPTEVGAFLWSTFMTTRDGRASTLPTASDKVAVNDGSDDMTLLLQDHGGCGGKEFGTTYATLKRFVQDHGGPRPAASR